MNCYKEYKIVRIMWDDAGEMSKKLNEALEEFDNKPAGVATTNSVVDRVAHGDDSELTFLLSRDVR